MMGDSYQGVQDPGKASLKGAFRLQIADWAIVIKFLRIQRRPL